MISVNMGDHLLSRMSLIKGSKIIKFQFHAFSLKPIKFTHLFQGKKGDHKFAFIKGIDDAGEHIHKDQFFCEIFPGVGDIRLLQHLFKGNKGGLAKMKRARIEP